MSNENHGARGKDRVRGTALKASSVTREEKEMGGNEDGGTISDTEVVKKYVSMTRHMSLGLEDARGWLVDVGVSRATARRHLGAPGPGPRRCCVRLSPALSRE